MKSAGLVVMISVYACSMDTDTRDVPQAADNQELRFMYEESEADRVGFPVEWKVVHSRDSLRECRVFQLLDSGKVITSADCYYAAQLLQRGQHKNAAALAVVLAQKSVELNDSTSKACIARAVDRYLMKQGKPQIYGTQFIRSASGKWVRYQLDSTIITDQERQSMQVETLGDQWQTLQTMNAGVPATKH